MRDMANEIVETGELPRHSVGSGRGVSPAYLEMIEYGHGHPGVWFSGSEMRFSSAQSSAKRAWALRQSASKSGSLWGGFDIRARTVGGDHRLWFRFDSGPAR